MNKIGTAIFVDVVAWMRMYPSVSECIHLWRASSIGAVSRRFRHRSRQFRGSSRYQRPPASNGFLKNSLAGSAAHLLEHIDAGDPVVSTAGITAILKTHFKSGAEFNNVDCDMLATALNDYACFRMLGVFNQGEMTWQTSGPSAGSFIYRGS